MWCSTFNPRKGSDNFNHALFDETKLWPLINVIFKNKFMHFKAFVSNFELVRFVWYEIKEKKRKKELYYFPAMGLGAGYCLLHLISSCGK